MQSYALIASDEEAAEVLKHYRWASQRKRPQLGLNIAVGVTVKNPTGQADLSPIGGPAKGNSNGGGSGFGSGSSDFGGGMNGSQPNAGNEKGVAETTGDFGKQLVAAFKEKHESGAWSPAFSEYMLMTARAGIGAGGNNGAFGEGFSNGNGDFGFSDGNSGEMQSGNIGGSGSFQGEEMNSGGGNRPNSGGTNFGGPPNSSGMGKSGGSEPNSGGAGPGGVAPAQFQGKGGMRPIDIDGGAPTSGGPGMGGPGMGGPGMGGPGMGGPGMGMPPAFAANAKLPPGSSPLAPCLTFIGVDESNKLIKKASQEGYDGLMLFEVTVGFNRNLGIVVNDTLVRVVQPSSVPKDVKRVYVSKSLNNVQYAKSKAKGDPDGLAETVQKIVRETEEGLALQPLPAALTPEVIATKRVPSLASETEISVIDRLSEVNLYYFKGFIDEKQKADAFEKIAGQAGRTIATGSSTERLASVEKLLEREFK